MPRPRAVPWFPCRRSKRRCAGLYPSIARPSSSPNCSPPRTRCRRHASGAGPSRPRRWPPTGRPTHLLGADPADGSITQRAAVLARLGAADQDAAVPIDLDGLRAAPRRRCEGDVVAAFLEALDGRGRRAVLNQHALALEEETRRVDRLLHV